MSYRLTYPLLKEVEQLVSEKLVGKQKHPDYDIFVYNYSPKAQFMPVAEWTPALSDCRGLILNEHGEIVARGFRKFWNLEQVITQVPNDPFTVWEKVDGSLGILAEYEGHRITATRGSFLSDQAKWFSAWMDKNYPSFLPIGVTCLFELVFPSNRIVVDYGSTEEAFLLAVLETATGVFRNDLFDEWGEGY